MGCIGALWGTRITIPAEKKDDKDHYVRTTIRELILYLIFLVNLCCMTLIETSSTHFYYTSVLQSLFLDKAPDSGNSFRGLSTLADFWDFAEGMTHIYDS